MPRSMTGYGGAESEGPKGRFRADLRAVNGRFLEIRVRVPPILGPFESDIRRRLAESFQRGRLDLSLVWEPTQDAQSPITMNAGLAKAYLEAVERLRGELRLSGGLEITHVLALPGVVEMARGASADAELRDLAMEAVAAAARDVEAMREAEGLATAADVGSRLARISTLREKISSKAAGVPLSAQKKLQDRLARLGVDASLDPVRLAQEVAYLADRSDISEELSRLDAHLERSRQTLARDHEPCGKTLEFLAQELQREANTIGSKSSDIEISGWVLEMKTEIERVREQVLNLE